MTTTPTQTCLSKLADHAAHELEMRASNRPTFCVFTKNLGELLIEAGSVPEDQQASEGNRHVLAALRSSLKDAGNASRPEIRSISRFWGERLLGSTFVDAKTKPESLLEMNQFATKLSAASQMLATPPSRHSKPSHALV